MNRFVILGAGGFAREVAYNLIDCGHSPDLFDFVDDLTETKIIYIKGVPCKVIKNWSFAKNSKFLIGVGIPKHKKILVDKAISCGLEPHLTLVHPRSVLQDVSLGLGGIITAGVIATTNIKIGNFVILNWNVTVGHDSVIEDYVTCNPSSSISGNVILKDSCFIGVGAVVREKISIGNRAIVGGQSFVCKNVSDDVTVVGVPSKKLLRS